MRIKNLVAALSGVGYLIAAKIAAADNTAGITVQSADAVGSKVVEIAKDIIMPLGSAVVFICIAIAAVKLIIAANKPEERAKTFGGIPYIVAGGILLGGIMMAAGFIIGLMSKAAGVE